MNKAEQIRKLSAKGVGPARIAVLLGCDISYVSAVKQREKAGGQRPCDKRCKARWQERRTNATH